MIINSTDIMHINIKVNTAKKAISTPHIKAIRTATIIVRIL